MPGTDLRRPPSSTTSTVAAELEEIVGGTFGVMTVYPAYPRWTVSHFADDRIVVVEGECESVVTIHIGITATSSARTVARDVWERATTHLERSGSASPSTVEVTVCSIG